MGSRRTGAESFTTSLRTGKDLSQKYLTSRSPHPSPACAWLGGFAMAKLIFLLTVRDSASPRGACRAANTVSITPGTLSD